MKNTIWVVDVLDKTGSLHVIELFSNEKTAREYWDEMSKLYPVTDGWQMGIVGREVDQEHLQLTGNRFHAEKALDTAWVSKYNTDPLAKVGVEV